MQIGECNSYTTTLWGSGERIYMSTNVHYSCLWCSEYLWFKNMFLEYTWFLRFFRTRACLNHLPSGARAVITSASAIQHSWTYMQKNMNFMGQSAGTHGSKWLCECTSCSARHGPIATRSWQRNCSIPRRFQERPAITPSALNSFSVHVSRLYQFLLQFAEMYIDRTA